jgi:hypothetical protein
MLTGIEGIQHCEAFAYTNKVTMISMRKFIRTILSKPPNKSPPLSPDLSAFLFLRVRQSSQFHMPRSRLSWTQFYPVEMTKRERVLHGFKIYSRSNIPLANIRSLCSSSWACTFSCGALTYKFQ